MKCPKCGEETPFAKDRCRKCGTDLKDFKELVAASNYLYNEALDKAKVRDLSGAVKCLRDSLRLYKYNIDARNLLGLVYYEEGEAAFALSEWVLSKNFDNTDDNIAGSYIDMIQKNPTVLNDINERTDKYNKAYAYVQEGSYDMAVIQLKKLSISHPRYIRASLLLALLYIHSGKKEDIHRARKILKNVLKVDVANTAALRYLKEIPAKDNGVIEDEHGPKLIREDDGRLKVMPVSVDTYEYKPMPYREERPVIMNIILIAAGLLAGILIMAFVVNPAIARHNSSKTNKDFLKYSENLATSELDMQTVQAENDKLKSQVDELNAKIESLQGGDPTDIANYKKMYESIIRGLDLLYSGKKEDRQKAAESIIDIDPDELDSDTALAAYNKIKDETFEEVSDAYYEQGNDAYNGEGDYSGGRDYKKAIKLLKKALKFDPDNTNAIYFLGRCYQQQNKFDQAKEYYKQIVNDYPDSTKYSEAKSRLREMGISVEGSTEGQSTVSTDTDNKPDNAASPTAKPKSTPKADDQSADNDDNGGNTNESDASAGNDGDTADGTADAGNEETQDNTAE
ncbi:MAG: tetratricopeptide repeat protein [Lachnospiraceae bacterium]|jgi:tetratricopeptide (TPR) repeat protein|nr:tetratricopeptide repeat protein [Lachnospiraceae bacterium]MEE3461361.1 tetratricopeptide repeat protein [Lachnospiraceae bacterium]